MMKKNIMSIIKNRFFAYTNKKGGWDCLRHYEILANGCIPIFKNLDNSPKYTITTLPKELIIETNQKLLPYKNNYKEVYYEYAYKIIEHVKNNCSTSATAKYFLEKMRHIQNIKNVLLITCHNGVNYTRELF